MPELRWLIARDLPEVCQIDFESFAESWGLEDFKAALRQKNIIGMVAEDCTGIVGYMVYLLNRRSIDLLRLAVHPEYRRQGIGRQMLRKLESKIHTPFRNAVTFDVPEELLPAHLWLKACGWRAERAADEHYRFAVRCAGGVEAEREWV